MSKTFSTLNREVASGRVYSSRQGVDLPTTSAPIPGPTPSPPSLIAPSHLRPQGQTSEVEGPSSSEQRTRIMHLTRKGLPSIPSLGPLLTGSVTLYGGSKVQSIMKGFQHARDPALRSTLWLIADLPLPLDLDPRDLSALPRGRDGTGNAPGALYTVDGNCPTYGTESNTLTVSVSPGQLLAAPDGTWRLETDFGPQQNQAFHPLALLGAQAFSDMNTPLPSGTVARILTDLYMRPATVFPYLPLTAGHADRLIAITHAVLNQPSLTFLELGQFNRSAVTLEGPVRSTPALLPTRNACLLISSGHA